MCKFLKTCFIDKLITMCSRLFVHDFRTESFVLSSNCNKFVLEGRCRIQRFVPRNSPSSELRDSLGGVTVNLGL